MVDFIPAESLNLDSNNQIINMIRISNKDDDVVSDYRHTLQAKYRIQSI